MSAMEEAGRIARKMHDQRIKKSKALIRGLKKAGNHIKKESQKLVPVDTGALKKSVRVEIHDLGHTAEVEVSYNTPYALVQHENLEYNHQVGQAKYLEQPMRTERKIVMGMIRDEVRKG